MANNTRPYKPAVFSQGSYPESTMDPTTSSNPGQGSVAMDAEASSPSHPPLRNGWTSGNGNKVFVKIGKPSSNVFWPAVIGVTVALAVIALVVGLVVVFALDSDDSQTQIAYTEAQIAATVHLSDGTYTDDMADSSSSAFAEVETEACDTWDSVYTDLGHDFENCTLEVIWNGSIWYNITMNVTHTAIGSSEAVEIPHLSAAVKITNLTVNATVTSSEISLQSTVYQRSSSGVKISDACSSTPCEHICIGQGRTQFVCDCYAGYNLTNVTTCPEIDECLSNPCANGATCRDAISSFSCNCVAGYTGILCETDIDECLGNQCENGATCIDGINAYSCTCAAGYTGTYCETDIDDCVGNSCENGATCVDSLSAYSCTCVTGYTGVSCQTDIDDCPGHACVNGATCVDGVNSYGCTCATGYEGTSCETEIDECQSSPCENGGACQDEIGGYTCTCASGFAGDHCQINIDDCETHECRNGAACVDGINNYGCICARGYEGTHCENDIDECQSSPCENGATCIDGIGYYFCICVSGYEGLRCEENINDCPGHSCENGATCVDGINAYSCICRSGYEDYYCESDIDECLGSPCVNGDCHNWPGSFSCICAAGYSGVFCQTDPCGAFPALDESSSAYALNSNFNAALGYSNVYLNTSIVMKNGPFTRIEIYGQGRSALYSSQNSMALGIFIPFYEFMYTDQGSFTYRQTEHPDDLAWAEYYACAKQVHDGTIPDCSSCSFDVTTMFLYELDSVPLVSPMTGVVSFVAFILSNGDTTFIGTTYYELGTSGVDFYREIAISDFYVNLPTNDANVASVLAESNFGIPGAYIYDVSPA